MVTFPPSPGLSDCDSLCDIDDLDAFLDSKGRLSHFPTPPAKKIETIVYETEIDPRDDSEELDYYHIAKLFTGDASIGVEFSEIDIRMIERMLDRANLPPEVLALAFNIVCGLECHSLPVGSFYSAPNDLIVVSALSLAVSYTDDHPPTAHHWARYVCDGAWTANRIEKTTLHVFAALGWRLHQYSSPYAIQRALRALGSSIPVKTFGAQDPHPWETKGCTDFTVPEQLKLIIDGSSAAWVNGQVTPDGTPPTENHFLPVL